MLCCESLSLASTEGGPIKDYIICLVYMIRFLLIRVRGEGIGSNTKSFKWCILSTYSAQLMPCLSYFCFMCLAINEELHEAKYIRLLDLLQHQ